MKHKLPIAIFIVAIATAITGVISFQSGVFQTASIGELFRTVKKTPMPGIIMDLTSHNVSPDMPTSL